MSCGCGGGWERTEQEERRVGSDGVYIATPARTTSTDRGTIETRVAGIFRNVVQCLVESLQVPGCDDLLH